MFKIKNFKCYSINNKGIFYNKIYIGIYNFFFVYLCFIEEVFNLYLYSKLLYFS